jgi:RNA polymerase sigma-70 factor (ECF subfamily)
VLTLDKDDAHDLMIRARAGDPDAFEAICRRGRPYIATVIRRLADPARVEDLTQEALLHAWRGLDTWQPTGHSVLAWLATIARHVVVDEYRRRQVRPREATFGDPADMPAPLVDPYAQILDRAQVATVLAPLVDEHRDVLALHYLSGLTQTEVAARLGLPLGTVKSRMHYAERAARRAAAEVADV